MHPNENISHFIEYYWFRWTKGSEYKKVPFPGVFRKLFIIYILLLKPKSQILGIRIPDLSYIKIFWGFKSRCMILFLCI